MNSPRLLHIETSAEICSVCISVGKDIKATALESEKYSHSAVITVLIKDVCDRSGIPISSLDAVSVSAGPGSYTGLRVGMSTAKSICYAKDVPLIGVSTLESLMAPETAEDFIGYVSMVDARRMEVYFAHYDGMRRMVSSPDNLILEPESFDVILDRGKVIFSGNGSKKFEDICHHPNAIFSSRTECKAENLVSVALQMYQNGNFKDIAYFSPIYIKPPNITKPKNKFV